MVGLNVFRLKSDHLLKALAFVFVVNLLSCSVFATKTCKYLIPKSYTGWVRVYTGIEGAEKIPISDDGLIYTFKVAADGKLITSTSADSEAYIEFYFYDSNGITRIQRTNEKDDIIHAYRSVAYQIPCVFINEKADDSCEGIKYNYEIFYVGTFNQHEEEMKRISRLPRFEYLDKFLYEDLKGYVELLKPQQ